MPSRCRRPEHGLITKDIPKGRSIFRYNPMTVFGSIRFQLVVVKWLFLFFFPLCTVLYKVQSNPVCNSCMHCILGLMQGRHTTQTTHSERWADQSSVRITISIYDGPKDPKQETAPKSKIKKKVKCNNSNGWWHPLPMPMPMLMPMLWDAMPCGELEEL